jgi:hypothetical protein
MHEDFSELSSQTSIFRERVHSFVQGNDLDFFSSFAFIVSIQHIKEIGKRFRDIFNWLNY